MQTDGERMQQKMKEGGGKEGKKSSGEIRIETTAAEPLWLWGWMGKKKGWGSWRSDQVDWIDDRQEAEAEAEAEAEGRKQARKKSKQGRIGQRAELLVDREEFPRQIKPTTNWRPPKMNSFYYPLISFVGIPSNSRLFHCRKFGVSADNKRPLNQW